MSIFSRLVRNVALSVAFMTSAANAQQSFLAPASISTSSNAARFTGRAEIQPFYDAAYEGDLERVKTALENNPGITPAEKENAMRIGAMGGRMNVVRFFVEEMDVNPRANDEEAALAALLGEHKNVFYYLLSKGVNARKPVFLLNAAGGDDFGLVLALIRQGADIHGEPDAYDTPFIRASKHGRVEIMALLALMGADIHEQNERALRDSATHGQSANVRWLLQNTADPFSIKGADAAQIKQDYPDIHLLIQKARRREIWLRDQQPLPLRMEY